MPEAVKPRVPFRSDHCFLCKSPLYVFPSPIPELCQTCVDIYPDMEVCANPCLCCGRRLSDQFVCEWCGRWVCSACVSKEHDLEVCSNGDQD
jgi:hypothetical protein